MMAARTSDVTANNHALVLWSFVRAVVAVTRWKLAGAGALMVGLAVTSGATVLLLVPLLQASGVDAGQTAHHTSRLFASVLALVGVRPSLGVSLVALVLATGAQAALNLLQLRLAVAMNHDVVSGLRRELFDRFCRVEWVHFSSYRSSDLLDTLTAQAERAGYAARSLIGLGTGIVTAAVYVALAFSLSVPMTVVSLGTGAALMLLLHRRRQQSAHAGEAQATVSRQLYASLVETLTNMKTIRAYGAEQQHALELAGIAKRERQLNVRVAGAYGLNKFWFDVGAVSLLGLVAFLAMRQFAVPAAELFVLLVVFMRLTPQLSSIHQSYQTLLVDLPAFAAIVATERRCEAAAEPMAPGRTPVVFEREIRVDHATFGYGPEVVLEDVTIVIPAGRTVAVVGPSGGGKSTLADLVLGLLRPRAGRIVVDGAPLTPDRMSAWRDQIGYVPQETLLFHDTVRANLLWAAPNATTEELWDALRSAAAGFVADLPGGLDTVVGDRGVLLSGGERQRLALARALLRRPRLLILDEATSSLDSENERVIEQAADQLRGRVAILVITHRLSTVRGADTIYVLDKGRLVESGPWHELLARRGGRFQALCRAQGIQPDAVADTRDRRFSDVH